MTDLRIRAANEDDLAVLQVLNLVTYDVTNSPGDPPDADADLFVRHEPADYLMAESGGTIVGFVILGHPTPLPASAHVCQIQGLGVDPDHRGRGIAGVLVRAAVAEAQRRGSAKVSLRVLGTNPGARRVYEAAGFTVEATLRREFFLDGQLVDDLLMAIHF